MFRLGLAVAGAALLSGVLGAQAPAQVRVEALMEQPAIRAALDFARSDERRVLDDQVEVTEIAAPPFHEAARAEAMKRRFEAAGLSGVHLDTAGNVIGERPGTGNGPHVVLAAHLDTVFAAETSVRVQRDGTLLRAPGIADNGRGLAVLLGIARALAHAGVRTPGTITFVADVGEEGLGDLRGMKQLFGHDLERRVDAFVSVDGAGYSITNVAVGSRRYRVTFRGPGGHSFASFGLVNPLHALGRAISRIADLQPPRSPRVTFNVGRVGGGTSVNSIPSDAWFEIDLRSSDASALNAVDASFKKAVEAAARDEEERWHNGRLAVSIDLVGDRPAGRTPESAPIVATANAVHAALGLPAGLGEGSTDANLPISLGIPAITVGGGGRSSGSHSPQESFEATDAWRGTQAVLLLVVTLAQ